MTLATLFEEVGQTATIQNARVIRLLYDRQIRIMEDCTQCIFPKHILEFEELLARYKKYLKSAREHESHYNLKRECYYSRFHADVCNWDRINAENVRIRLKEIWPCDECKLIFNPTFKRFKAVRNGHPLTSGTPHV